MSQLARNDEKVSGLMIQERYEQASGSLLAGAGPQEDAIESGLGEASDGRRGATG